VLYTYILVSCYSATEPFKLFFRRIINTTYVSNTTNIYKYKYYIELDMVYDIKYYNKERDCYLH